MPGYLPSKYWKTFQERGRSPLHVLLGFKLSHIQKMKIRKIQFESDSTSRSQTHLDQFYHRVWTRSPIGTFEYKLESLFCNLSNLYTHTIISMVYVSQ